VTVACAPEFDDARPASLLNPLLIVEVASPSTADLDRTVKLEAYTQIASLKAYWIFDQEQPAAMLYERRGDLWAFRALRGLDATLVSPLFDTEFSFADLYDGVEFGERSAADLSALGQT
jgi:Uma2 family endonuclease